MVRYFLWFQKVFSVYFVCDGKSVGKIRDRKALASASFELLARRCASDLFGFSVVSRLLPQ